MAAFFKIPTSADHAPLAARVPLRLVWRIGADGRPAAAWAQRCK